MVIYENQQNLKYRLASIFQLTTIYLQIYIDHTIHNKMIQLTNEHMAHYVTKNYIHILV